MKGTLFKMMKGYLLSIAGNIDEIYGISDEDLADDHEWHLVSETQGDEIFKQVDEQEYQVDVEILTETIHADRAPNGFETLPKKDDNNCLILKKI